MILSASFSKPGVHSVTAFGRIFNECTKVRLDYNAKTMLYDASIYTKTQCTVMHVKSDEAQKFIAENSGTSFKNVVCRTQSKETVTLTNRHGKSRTLSRALDTKTQSLHEALYANDKPHNRKKNYLLPEGERLPFLVKLGVQTKDGKTVASKQNKFRQINRFLEFVDDLLPYLEEQKPQKKFTQQNPLRIADFGSGKSYLTFAVYWYLHEKKSIPVDIIGLDLKKDVIQNCSRFAEECSYTGLHFFVGSIEGFTYQYPPDLIITLHACDTATDAALKHAVSQGTNAILSVPCCQHEINAQLDSKWKNIPNDSEIASLMQYGILRERFSALATDALRAEYLTQNGYDVQLLEFIDQDLTPKNLLIRATKKHSVSETTVLKSMQRKEALLKGLGVHQALSD